MDHIVTGPDGRDRCWWGSAPEEYRAYHDTEWGFAQTDDHRLFEKLCLEGFQAGLSWLTILRKRDAFRTAFCDFDPATVTAFDDSDVARLLADASIVRHEGKIRSTINNARRCLELAETEGSLSRFVWTFADPSSDPPPSLEPTTPTSKALAKELKSRGWTFVGPTTVHAFMQAMGLVNDHFEGCWVRTAATDRRREVLAAHR